MCKTFYQVFEDDDLSDSLLEVVAVMMLQNFSLTDFRIIIGNCSDDY